MILYFLWTAIFPMKWDRHLVAKAEGQAEALPDSEAGGTPNSPAVLASKGA